jgi:hypothetical protein
VIAGTRFHDDFFSFVSLYGDAAVDEPCLYERGTRGIAERHGDAIGARLRLCRRLFFGAGLHL